MAQHDGVIDNGSGAVVRADINGALAALMTNNSGSSAPTTTYPYMWWPDVTNGLLKQRNGANTAWVTIGPLDTTAWGLLPLSGGSLAGAINHAKGASVASAATTNIWATDGNTIHITGTTTITSFGTAPQAGATRRLVFDGVLTLTNGANLILPGGANITTAAGDACEVFADSTTQHRVISYTKADGTPLAAPSTVKVSVPQTVLAGAVDSNGQANFLSAGSGRAVNLAATSVPVVIAFSAGEGINGDTNYVGIISADVTSAWSGLSANATSYLYVDRNTSTGALTYGATTTAPVYGYGTAKSTASGAHTFRIDEMVMYAGNGSAASAVQRVFVGEAVTDASSVTSVTTYALRGKFLRTGISIPALGTATTLTHNIGISPYFIKASVLLECGTAQGNYSVGDITDQAMEYGSSGTPSAPVSAASLTSLSITKSRPGTATVLTNKTTGAAVNPLTAANWTYIFKAERTW